MAQPPPRRGYAPFSLRVYFGTDPDLLRLPTAALVIEHEREYERGFGFDFDFDFDSGFGVCIRMNSLCRVCRVCMYVGYNE